MKYVMVHKVLIQLTEEYATCYRKAETYIRLSNLYGPDNEENCIMQILDDFLSAQKDEKPIIKITGTDLRKYCDTVLKAEFSRNHPRGYIMGQIVIIPFAILILMFFKELHTSIDIV
jgi:DNA-binding ferritin-like protein (Dps family)